MNTRLTRRKRIRARVMGTAARPRMAVFRSNKFVYAQIINDDKGVTVAESHGKDALGVGTDISKKAKAKKVNTVVFDRGGYQYHGKLKILAEAARKGGLKF